MQKSRPLVEEEGEPEATALSRTLASTQTLQLAEIHTLDAFFTPIEDRFERLTRLGRKAIGVPIFAITAITQDTQWFKSVLGWNVSELRLEDSLCNHAVKTGKAVMVGDLSHNPRFANHPMVARAPKFRFYCGVPLRNARGTIIGTLCAIGRRPKKVTGTDVQLLVDLAALAERELLTIALHNAQTNLISKLSIARRQAMIDPLTKTWNRRGGMMLIDESLVQAERQKKSTTILAIDIDDFKMVNDTFGHAAGDSALRMVARELLTCFRDGDGVCRFGGDEFFVVVQGATQHDAVRMAHRLQASIKQNVIEVKGGGKARVTVSVGIEHAEPGHGSSAGELLAAADARLYDNKMQNRLRVDVV